MTGQAPPWLMAGGVIGGAFAIGLAGWNEEEDLRVRFGASWHAYRDGVHNWRPRWRPWMPKDESPARLYVAAGCHACEGFRGWLERRDPRGLAVVEAQRHPSGTLMRVTYETADGYRVQGVAAIARALEHLQLVWALAGFILRLPVIAPLLQVLVDGSGGHARRVEHSAAAAFDAPARRRG